MPDLYLRLSTFTIIHESGSMALSPNFGDQTKKWRKEGKRFPFLGVRT